MRNSFERLACGSCWIGEGILICITNSTEGAFREIRLRSQLDKINSQWPRAFAKHDICPWKFLQVNKSSLSSNRKQQAAHAVLLFITSVIAQCIITEVLHFGVQVLCNRLQELSARLAFSSFPFK